MPITDPLVLPPDVMLLPVAELPEDVRRQLTWEEGDYAVTRPRSRTPSRIVDAGAADLLGQFREPVTIVEAVIRFSRERSLDPETTLEEAYPLLERLLASGFLVSEGSDDAGAIQESLKPGEEIAGFEVLECVQGLEDTELYQVKSSDGTAALKIERPQAAGRVANDFAREAAILEHLAGEIAPRLLAQGEVHGRHYLAIEWCPGVDGYAAAAELRRGQDRAGLLALARSVLDAYVRLQDRGVVHGDVHPRNILVSAAGEARLIDFGIARWEASPASIPRPWRGGVAFFFEPEYAVPVRAGQTPPEASTAAEQYAVAALLYYSLTGAHYRDFSLEKDKMLRQIAEEPPLPFVERGAASWPEVEAILARALSKAPEERFLSMAALAEAFAGVEPPAPAAPRKASSESNALFGRVLDRLRPDGALFREGFPEAPKLSINYGAAGAACTLYRIAMTQEDAELLSRADLWAVKATSTSPDEGFYNAGKQLDRETLGLVTPYHTPSGPRAMQALVAHAQGDLGVQRRAVAGFLEAVAQPCPNPDLTLGRSGVLLAASMLLDTLGTAEEELARRLRELGDGLVRDLWTEIAEQPPIARAAPTDISWVNLGMAHGWAGYLYATLRWCRSAGSPRPEGLEERLAELAGCARSWGRGLRWPWRDNGTGPGAHMPGWCNGSAGFVHLWTLASKELNDPAWMAFAEGAAWNSWEASDRNASLCCGLAGRAYALLDFWRCGGGDIWLERARDLAESAAVEVVRFSEAADSLYKGEPGVAALIADLARPEMAAQPFFGDEGWG
ncbi:MAG: eukaryotic-like serine/threonine-protein kinase [Acidobacteriota bacterium]|jgi:serine/threonine-protein kinase|nr:eukaryotic-like serine/threonine-protein kinase [Acidobacteriota bacterium]